MMRIDAMVVLGGWTNLGTLFRLRGVPWPESCCLQRAKRLGAPSGLRARAPPELTHLRLVVTWGCPFLMGLGSSMCFERAPGYLAELTQRRGRAGC